MEVPINASWLFEVITVDPNSVLETVLYRYNYDIVVCYAKNTVFIL